MKKRAQEKAREDVQNKKELMEGNKAKHTALFVVIFLASFIYIFWRLFFTLPWDYGIVSVICGVILWFSESVTVLETFTHFNNVRNVVIPEMPVIPDDMYPTVDVMIATHNESRELLYKTLNGCKHMEYPDKSKVHIYICDDNKREEIRELAEHLEVGYFACDNHGHAKAGNLNYALPYTHSELIAIFDADMIPTSDFLMETAPYFFRRDMIKDKDTKQWRKRTDKDPESTEKVLGYVQTQQSFYNPDPLQRNLYMENSAPNEQDYFYRSVNVARMHSESAAFAGSNTLFSRAVLEDVGGFAVHSITEDFATSIAILGKGYGSMAVAKELAHGLSPEDVFSFIKQRQRWSRGAAQGIMTKKFWFSGMSFKQTWGFLVAYNYWWTFVRRFIFLMCPIMYGIFGVRVADVTFLQLIAVWLPYYIVYNLGLQVMSGQTTSALWSDRVDTIQFPYMMGPIIKGTLMIPQKTFAVTPKDRLSGKNSNIRLAWPHIVLTILTVFTILVCLRDFLIYEIDGSIIVLFWSVYNLLALVSAIVYYAGRTNNRYSERIPIPVNVELKPDHRVLRGVTADLSEGGMAVVLDTPEFLPYEDDFLVTVTDNGYTSEMRMSVRQVQLLERQWKYSLVITDITEKDNQEYLQIIYDRPHVFPRLVDVGVVKDFRLIYRGMNMKYQRGERRLPRVDLGVLRPTVEAGEVELIDFNYKYIMLKGGSNLPEDLTILFPGDIPVPCFLDPELNGDKSFKKKFPLYQVKDWETLAIDDAFRQSVMGMIQWPEPEVTDEEDEEDEEEFA